LVDQIHWNYFFISLVNTKVVLAPFTCISWLNECASSNM